MDEDSDDPIISSVSGVRDREHCEHHCEDHCEDHHEHREVFFDESEEGTRCRKRRFVCADEENGENPILDGFAGQVREIFAEGLWVQ